MNLTSLSRVRWLEGLVVFHERRGLLGSRSVWIVTILTNDLPVGVEEMSLLGLLRELLAIMDLFCGLLNLQALFDSHLFGSVIVILNVGNLSTKGSILANISSLGRVGEHVAWPNHDLTTVLLRSEVLLNLFEVFHVLVGGVCGLSNMLGRTEGLLVSSCNLLGAIYLTAHHGLGSLLEGVADGVVGWSHELLRFTTALLDGAGSDVGWVNLNFLHVGVGNKPCY